MSMINSFLQVTVHPFSFVLYSSRWKKFTQPNKSDNHCFLKLYLIPYLPRTLVSPAFYAHVHTGSDINAVFSALFHEKSWIWLDGAAGSDGREAHRRRSGGEKITAMHLGVPLAVCPEWFRGLRGRQSGCDRLRLNAIGGAFLTHATASWTAA